jgi:hypothetical protein
MNLVAATDREQAGKTVRSATQTAAAQHPGRSTPSRKTAKLRLDERRHRRQRIRDIVDEDLDVDGVDGGKVGHDLTILPQNERHRAGGLYERSLTAALQPVPLSAGNCTHLAR